MDRTKAPERGQMSTIVCTSYEPAGGAATLRRGATYAQTFATVVAFAVLSGPPPCPPLPPRSKARYASPRARARISSTTAVLASA
jgi:hypothetical protein